MTREILGGFGPNSLQPQKPRATSGGVTTSKDVMNYMPPQGPTNIMDPKGPGLHGTNHGNEAKNMHGGKHSGSSGIGGTNHGCCGSQGKY